MAKRQTPAESPVATPNLPPAQGHAKLLAQLNAGNTLALAPPVTEEAFSAWYTKTRHWLEEAFGKGSSKVNEVLHAGGMKVFDVHASEAEHAEDRRQSLRAKLTKLGALVEVLADTVSLASPAEKHLQETPERSVSASRRVFVVHGTDEASRESVARFLERLGLEAVVLHEQPNAGKTLIEKFEAHAAVAYAVVILTPDDRGGPAVATNEDLKGRARQNVVFELGYFFAHLGRHRVCALYKEGTELPSDLSGVVYVPLDAGGGWRLRLAKEIKGVIADVDLNRAI